MDIFPDDICEDRLFKNVRWDGRELARITFEDCRFNGCSFKETAFLSCRFQNCVFEKCDLSLAKVDKSIFTHTRFEDSKLIGVEWVNASWAKKEIQRLLQSIDFTRCVLNYSTFMGLTLEKMVLKKCTAKEVDFTNADLRQADCTFTDFENSPFIHTDLSEADLRGATHYMINPLVNTLKKAKFSLPEAMALLYSLEIEISASAEEGDEIVG
jgi:fluoroquinolone resistance protein